MLNQYSIWKYFILVIVLIASVLYATPNLYSNDPALQVSSNRGAEITIATQERIKKLLDNAGVPFKSIALANEQILIRFSDTNKQLQAKDLVKEIL